MKLAKTNIRMCQLEWNDLRFCTSLKQAASSTDHKNEAIYVE